MLRGTRAAESEPGRGPGPHSGRETRPRDGGTLRASAHHWFLSISPGRSRSARAWGEAGRTGQGRLSASGRWTPPPSAPGQACVYSRHSANACGMRVGGGRGQAAGQSHPPTVTVHRGSGQRETESCGRSPDILVCKTGPSWTSGLCPPWTDRAPVPEEKATPRAPVRGSHSPVQPRLVLAPGPGAQRGPRASAGPEGPAAAGPGVRPPGPAERPLQEPRLWPWVLQVSPGLVPLRPRAPGCVSQWLCSFPPRPEPNRRAGAQTTRLGAGRGPLPGACGGWEPSTAWKGSARRPAGSRGWGEVASRPWLGRWPRGSPCGCLGAGAACRRAQALSPRAA